MRQWLGVTLALWGGWLLGNAPSMLAVIIGAVLGTIGYCLVFYEGSSV